MHGDDGLRQPLRESFLATNALDEAPNVLSQAMDRRGGVSSSDPFRLPARQRAFGPFDRIRIAVLNYIPVVENLPPLLSVTRA